MERVRMINVQRLLEAAEFLERRERGNGWTPSLRPQPRAPRGECGAAGKGRCARVCGSACTGEGEARARARQEEHARVGRNVRACEVHERGSPRAVGEVGAPGGRFALECR